MSGRTGVVGRALVTGARRATTVAASPAARVGTVRLAVGTYTTLYLIRKRKALRALAKSDPALFAPVGPVRVLPKPLPVPVAEKIYDATVVTSGLFAAGAAHRFVGPLHSMLLTWTLSYRNSWSMIFHSDNTLVLHTLVLGASRAADAVSSDAIARGVTPPAHQRYAWPLTTMKAVSAAAYLLAGVAKVVGPSGWGWAKGDAMRRQVAIDQIRKSVFNSEIQSPAAYALYKHKNLFTAFAVGSLILELGAPLALLDRRVGRLWALSTFGMHWGIRAIMGIQFRYHRTGVAFSAWAELDRLPHLLGLTRGR